MNTLEITVQRNSSEGWPVVAEHGQSGMSLLARREGVLQLDVAELRGQGTPEDYGKLLGEALFRGELRDALIEAIARGNGRVRVLLFVEAPELRTLRWERLCAPLDGNWVFLALDQRTPLSLQLPSVTARSFPPIGRRDLRALVLATSPNDLQDYELSHFDVAAAVARVRRGLDGIPCDVLAAVEGARGPPTLDALCERITAEKYTILHLVCHGRLVRDGNETVLYLAREDGKADPVRATRLLQRLGQSGGAHGLPYFAFLACCESASSNSEEAIGGLAQQLVRELGIPAVVAMTGKVTVTTAEQLAECFYRRLREHGEADHALVEATAGLAGRGDINVPVLFARSGGLRVFSEIRDLDRPLTNAEIEDGLRLAETFLHLRAPVVRPKFDKSAATLRGMFNAEPAALSKSARVDREKALTEVDSLCEEALDLSFIALALGQSPPSLDSRCPFPGLSPFTVEDREFFFGRETLVKHLQQRLDDFHFLAVVGDSGSGKSSLVMAGLVPALQAGQRWTLKAEFMRPGSDPQDALAACLAKFGGKHAVLVVDQFEEVFTLCADEAKQRAFLDRLMSLPLNLRVVVTMRADFWGECARFEQLRRTMQAHNELVRPMGTAELRRAMEMQAEKVGLHFEADLSAAIIDDVHGEPGAMPLLQHALLELWKRRHGRWLRADEYRATGGVQGAIACTADATYEKLSRVEQDWARNIFVRLTRLDEEPFAGEERRDTRRRVGVQDLVSAGSTLDVTKALVDRLADSRLVVTKSTADGRNEVEVVHEALIRHWPRLRGWLDEDREFLLWRQRLRATLTGWAQGNQAEAVLLSGSPLFEAKRWLEDRSDQLNDFERGRIRESLKRSRRRKLFLTSITLIVMLVLALSTYFGFDQRNQALLQARTSLSRELAAQSFTNLIRQFQISLLLAVESLHVAPTLEAKDSLLSALQSNPRLIKFLWANGNSVSGVAFSKDGKTMVSAGGDGEFIRWDFAGGKPIDSAQVEDRRSLNSISFSPDGKVMAAASDDGAIFLWDVASGTGIGSPLRRHRGSAFRATFSPDGTVLASASYDRSVILWNVASQQVLGAPLTGHQGEVWDVAFSPDGKVLASASSDKTIILWDMSTGKPLGKPLVGHRDVVHSVAFSPDGKTLASGSWDNSIILWDIASSKPVGKELVGHRDWVSQVVFSPDGKKLASASKDTTVRLWDVATGTPLGMPLPGHRQQVLSVAFSPDGKNMVSGGLDGSIIVWDMSERVDFGTVLAGHRDEVFGVAVSPGGKILASASRDNTVILWDVIARKPLREPLKGHRDWVFGVAFSPDGNTLVSASADSTVILWDMVKHGSMGTPLVGHKDGVWCAAFSPDGRILATGSRDATIILWDTESLKPIRAPLTGHKRTVLSVAFSPDGKLLASTGYDGSIILWDAKSGALIRTLTGHNRTASSVAFTRNGKTLASGSWDGTVILWNVADGKQLRTLYTVPYSRVFSVAFSPDDRLLASANEGRAIVVWDTASGKTMGAPLTGHQEWVWSVAFSPDGKTLMSASGDKTIMIWDLDFDSLIRRACRIVNGNLDPSLWSQYLRDEPYRETCPGLP